MALQAVAWWVGHVRRRILDLLAQRGTLMVSQLAAAFPGLVTSGISKHLMGDLDGPDLAAD